MYRNSTRLFRIALGLAASVGIASAAWAAPFTNGSFELATVSPPPGSFVNVSDGEITGWTITAGNMDYIDNGFWQAAEGSRSLDMNGSTQGAISQTFDTIAGDTYQVTFSLAGSPFTSFGGGTIRTMTAAAAGESQDYSFDITGHSASNMGWVDKVFTFVANSNATTLTFTSTTTDNCCTGPALDNVRVADLGSVSPVPEPASLALLGTGLAGLWVVRRRRNRPCA